MTVLQLYCITRTWRWGEQFGWLPTSVRKSSFL